MENRNNADVDDVVKHSSNDDDERSDLAGAAAPTADLREAKIEKDGFDFAEEFPFELPSMAMPSDPSASPLYSSLLSPSASKVHDNDRGDILLEHEPPGEPPYASLPSASTPASIVNEDNDRDLAHGSVGDTKKLEHAPPGEAMPCTGLGMVDSSERPSAVAASNHEDAPGAFRVGPTSRNTAGSQTFRSPISLYDSTRELTNEESKHDEEVPNSAGAQTTSSHDGSRMAAGNVLLTVEAKPVPDGNEVEVTVMVAEAQYIQVKWYQRPLFRWIVTCSLVAAVVVLVVLVVRPPSAVSSSPTFLPQEPTLMTQELIACKFLSIPDLTECRSTLVFDSVNYGDRTTGSSISSEIGLLTKLVRLDFSYNSLTSSIPSEIGLLTQLQGLSFSNNALTSTIPSEIGLLTKLTVLSFWGNSLTSSIPSEIGLLTQLTVLSFSNNTLIGTIPSSLCSLPSPPSIYIDFGEITCDLGCCA